MMRLAISRNSWHCKYFEKLHRIWGMTFSKSDFPSLCKYSWMFFLLSLISFVSLPVVIIGWTFLKSLRFFYQVMMRFSLGGKFIDYIDDKIHLGKFIEDASERMIEDPMGTCFLMGVIALLIAASIFVFSVTIFYGLSILIQNILLIPHLFFISVLYVGWAFMNVFLTIGFLLNLFVYLSYNILIYIGPFIVPTLIIILKFLAICLVFSAFAVFSFYIIMKFFDTKCGKRIISYLSLKFNGFQKVREDTIKRREQYKEEKSRISKRKDITQRVRPSVEDNGPIFIVRWYKNIKECLFTGKREERDGKKINVLGFFPMIWKTLKPLKEGVCPFIEFIDEE